MEKSAIFDSAPKKDNLIQCRKSFFFILEFMTNNSSWFYSLQQGPHDIAVANDAPLDKMR